ncbi:apoptosis-inducing factor 3 isoform X16 [Equus caballus]|uniref:apoptosis-inducing factor 3 isoform X16 n=1 Tax=Equus caballus TaxID=9796 RepID=UPI000717C54E
MAMTPAPSCPLLCGQPQALQLQRRTKVMAKCISPSAGHSGSTNVLIVGAGAAGLVCAETLRQEGFSDRIVLCTLDRHLPYDRPKLSKSLDAQPEQLALRPKEFFRAYGIEVLTEAQVVTVDVRNKKVVFKDGFKLEYNKLLLAPGSSPKTLSCKGKEVENVFTLRTPEDANRVVRLARGRNAVVVGAGFLGMEVAAYLTEKAHSVSVVELEETPFRRFLGERVGRALMKMFENNRVKFYMQTEVSELRAQEGKLKEVVLKSSKVVRADVCVVGIGAVPATGFLRQSGISLDSRGFIPVNKMMQTNIPGVFAAGDAVTFPLAWRNNRKVNIPHWQMAHAQGRVAAQNMLAQEAEISTVPYLWTAMFGKSLRYAGYGEGFDDVIIQGDLEELKFVAFYTKGDEVIAVASMNYDPIVSKVAEVLASGRAIRKREDRRYVLAHRERILSLHAADLGRHAGAPGTEAKPWGQVPTSNFPGSPTREPESSQCLPWAAWLTSREALAASRCSPPKASAATKGWPWRQDRPCLFSCYWDWSPVGALQHIRHYLKIKTHTFADLCDFHCNWANTREGETGTATECSMPHQEVWPVSAQRR